VRLLLDTQLWVWLVTNPARLSLGARAVFADYDNTLVYSVVSIWEVAIKAALKRPDFTADPALLLDYLRQGPFEELDLVAEHILPMTVLPPVHKDPFDRILIAQAMSEQMELVTADRKLPAYPGLVRKV
jgi:PIN domain nuclease of toxin-antitoxin system